jgi:hypothetical protein
MVLLQTPQENISMVHLLLGIIMVVARALMMEAEIILITLDVIHL